MDRLVGRTLEYVDENTALFVLSDHGFCAFRRGVNLNSWLLQNGYLASPGWSHNEWQILRRRGLEPHPRLHIRPRRAVLEYRGREAGGTVSPEEAESLKQELIQKLSGSSRHP